MSKLSDFLKTGAAGVVSVADETAISIDVDENVSLANNLTVAGSIVEEGGVLKQNLLTGTGFEIWSNSGGLYTTAGTVPAIDDAHAVWQDNCADDDTGDFTKSANATLVHNGSVYRYGTSSVSSTLAYKTSAFATEVGKLYEFSVTISDGDVASKTFSMRAGTSAAGSQLGQTPTATTTATPTALTLLVKATTTTTYITFGADGQDYGGYITLDSIMVHEVTPGCTGGNSYGPDGWWKDSTLDLFREHTGTNTKGGSFYSLKTTSSVANDYLAWPSSASGVLPEHYEKFAGRTITGGVWIKTDTGSHARIQLYDGITYTYSDYHTGGGDWEWIEITKTMSASPTQARMALRCEITTTDAYFSQPMLVFGSSIGEGNYTRPQGEMIWPEQWIESNKFDSIFDGSNPGVIDIEVDSSGKIGKGVDAIHITGAFQAASGNYLQLYQNSSYTIAAFWMQVHSTGYERANGWINMNADGTYFAYTGGTTLMNIGIRYLGYKLR